MALTGVGIIPGGGVGNELQAVTRRAVLPACVVQIGKSTPTLSAMLSGSEPVSGGVSPMTIPIQGVRMVSGGPTDYSGAFTAPQIIPGMQNAQYNLKAYVTGIPYYMFEGLVQMDADIVPIIWARMNDVGNFYSDMLATNLWAAQSANSDLQIFSLNDIISTTDPTQGPVGGVSRSTYTFWQSSVTTIGTINPSSSAISRSNVLAAMSYAQKAAGGEPHSCAICSPGFLAALSADIIGAERYMVTPQGSYADAGEGAEVGFPAVVIGGIPVYADLYYPDNTSMTFLNFNYLHLNMHEDASFALAGPESLLPQFQLGYIMADFVLLETVCSKPSAQAKVTGWTGAYVI